MPLDVLRANGIDKAFAFGLWLGNRYKDFPNIIWLHGNDFRWRNVPDDALVQAVARGIRTSDKITSTRWNSNLLTSGSLDDPTWAPLIELDAAYAYFPMYARVLAEYNREDYKPVFLVETNYEFEDIGEAMGALPKPATSRILGIAKRRDWTDLRERSPYGNSRRGGKRNWIVQV